MKHVALAALIALPHALAASESEEPSLMERGAQLFLEGLMEEMVPAIEGLDSMARELGPAMTEMMQQMGPAFAELLKSIDDLSNYSAPEMLPNGDIIIRRREDAPALPEGAQPEIGDGGAVEL